MVSATTKPEEQTGQEENIPAPEAKELTLDEEVEKISLEMQGIIQENVKRKGAANHFPALAIQYTKRMEILDKLHDKQLASHQNNAKEEVVEILLPLFKTFPFKELSGNRPKTVPPFNVLKGSFTFPTEALPEGALALTLGI